MTVSLIRRRDRRTLDIDVTLRHIGTIDEGALCGRWYVARIDRDAGHYVKPDRIKIPLELARNTVPSLHRQSPLASFQRGKYSLISTTKVPMGSHGYQERRKCAT